MHVELKAVWTGDVHGPDRGLLCAKEAMHPIRPPAPIQPHCGPMIGRSRPSTRRVPTAFMRLTATVRAYLTTAEATIPQLMTRFDLSEDVVLTVTKSFRGLGILRTGILEQGMGRKRKVYWIQEDGKTTDDGRR